MAQFDFTVIEKGQVCLVSGSGSYVVERKAGDGWLPMVAGGVKLKVSPNNTCVLVPFAGVYRIAWPDEDCCLNGVVPEFEFVELGSGFVPAHVACLKAVDDPLAETFYGWASGCIRCGDEQVDVSLFDAEGVLLPAGEFKITKCC